MKDFPMFNKLFFVLCSSLIIAVSSPSAAEEPTYHTIQGSEGEYEIFGTNQEALSIKKTLSNKKTERLQKQIRTAMRFRDMLSKTTQKRRSLAHDRYHEMFARRIAMYREEIKAEEKKITAPLGAKREKKYKAAKIKAKLIEDAKRARLAKIAADKVIENARLAIIAEQKKLEGERLAKIAAAKKKEDARIALVMEEYRKQQLEKKISSVLKIIAGVEGPKDPNKITSITKDGLVRTIYCNPGPCTPGSVKLHEYITGIDMGVDVNTLAKRIKTNAAQKKRQDNTNENNAKTAEDMASLGNVSVDTLFEQSEADLDKTNDTKFARATSISIAQRIKNREAYTDYVRSAAENEAYCLYEGGC